ncbi:phosphoprotein phosphatase [Tritrichomonas foetus]|uniref:Phosphoprotein phosphatase n=1 Tax=Tritrichomonas foetus TaxID=1144522 RepID=A0A1J4L0J3_9EUKA|nr:phosphoprotein phosphatase [Tritrichomonas foetus]|eukprot:OHT15373.1 phosphoprotein phosphatase [Tritrichomonas foetus]
MEFVTFEELKLDEFFGNYLTDPNNRPIFQAVSQAARDLEMGKSVNFDFNLFDVNSSTVKRQRPPSMVSMARLFSVEQKSPAPKLNTSIEKTGEKIPTFYGRSENTKESAAVEELSKQKTIPIEKISFMLQTFCRLPKCFASIIAKKHCLSSGEKFKAFWKDCILGQDPNTRFFKFVAGKDKNFIVPSDFVQFVRSVVENHSSLEFLKEETLFQEKFIDFIVTRCFYLMDTDLRGTIGISQMRKIDLAATFFKAERMQDVNDSQHIFNYQHFYVSFCKFWDLDVDQDGKINRDDLLKFNDSAISPIIIDRYFSAKFFPRRGKDIDFTAFVYFLMSSEDKTNLTSINLWYRLCDLDDDGVLSIKEIEEIYQNQFDRMTITGYETIPFNDMFRQFIDMINPEGPFIITVHDLVKSKLADVFFNSLFDLQKLLYREYQYPSVNPELEELTKKFTPWEIYVLIEYDQLANDGS